MAFLGNPETVNERWITVPLFPLHDLIVLYGMAVQSFSCFLMGELASLSLLCHKSRFLTLAVNSVFYRLSFSVAGGFRGVHGP